MSVGKVKQVEGTENDSMWRIYFRLVKEVISDEVTFEQRPEVRGEYAILISGGKGILGVGKSKYKDS